MRIKHAKVAGYLLIGIFSSLLAFSISLPVVQSTTVNGVLRAFSSYNLAQVNSPSSVASKQDSDNDGLPDFWERNGYGPINLAEHRINALKQDVFLVVVLRPGMTRAQVKPTLARVREFFAEFPGRNPDGTTGINLVTIWGNTLAASDSTTDYREVYERGMPRSWRGIGHGVLIEPGIGGGGQTSRSDWSVVSNNWHTLVHELGHQFGLNHKPPGSLGQSPLYTSLMNYDYNYSFNGDPNAVNFSQGKFASVRLTETNLNEVLPFPMSELQFLNRQPYNFRVRGVGTSTTEVDWNRNGVLGEPSVRADINEGYAVTLREEHRLGKAAGSPSLVVSDRRLLAIYPDLNNVADYNGYNSASLSPGTPGRIVLRSYDSASWTERITLARSASGDPHATVVGKRLFIVYPVRNSYIIQQRDASPPFARRLVFGALDNISVGQQRHPILVTTNSPNQLWLFLWNETTNAITYRKVEIGTDSAPQLRLGPVQELRVGLGETSRPLLSQFPIHAVYDSDIKRIVLVTSERENTTDGRLKLHTLGRITEDRWYSQNERWTMGSGGYSRSRARPWILYDRSRERGLRGGYLVYHKGDVLQTNEPSTTWLSRTIADTQSWSGWRTSLLGNEWLTTRSTPAAAFYGNDIAYAMRWFGGELDHELLINLRSSGIQDGIIADHDDVRFIRTRGLHQSLGR